jgi:hypothetical protein
MQHEELYAANSLLESSSVVSAERTALSVIFQDQSTT